MSFLRVAWGGWLGSREVGNIFFINILSPVGVVGEYWIKSKRVGWLLIVFLDITSSVA